MDTIRTRIVSKGPAATLEDYDILNSITLWKANRQTEISSETVEYLCSVTRQVSTPEEALANPDTALLIDELLSSKGVQLALASTILKFYAPTAFPIIDQRAYFILHRRKLPPSAGTSVYLDYIRDLIVLRDRFGIPFQNVDQVLYQLDKASGRTLSTVDP